MPHGLVIAHPGSTTLAPSRAVEKSDIYPDPVAFVDHMHHGIPPLVAEQRHRAIHLIGIDVPDQYRSQSKVLHGLQVFGNPFFRNIITYPVIVTPGFVGIGRSDKSFLDLIIMLLGDLYRACTKCEEH